MKLKHPHFIIAFITSKSVDKQMFEWYGPAILRTGERYLGDTLRAENLMVDFFNKLCAQRNQGAFNNTSDVCVWIEDNIKPLAISHMQRMAREELRKIPFHIRMIRLIQKLKFNW